MVLIDRDEAELDQLEEAGLIQLSPLPRTVTLPVATATDSTEWWVLHENGFVVAVRKTAPLPGIARGMFPNSDVYIDKNDLKIAVITLTAAGMAISSIMPPNAGSVLHSLYQQLRRHGDPGDVKFQKLTDRGTLERAEMDVSAE
ncbi:hypothetical protein D3C87_1770570 [compost metagenome]